MYFILFYFILAQNGKILAQFLCKSFILFYFIANGRTTLASDESRHTQTVAASSALIKL